jgi:hypothetical protein
MFTNAALGGALGAAFVGIIVLQLNPQLSLAPRVLVPLYLTLLAFYGANLTVALYFLIVVRQLFASRVLSPGWISMRVLAWLGTIVCAIAAWLMLRNLEMFTPVLEAEASRRMALGIWATVACAVLLLVIAVLHYSSGGRRASAVGATLFALTVVAALMLPLTARGWGERPAWPRPPDARPQALTPPASPGRIHMVLLDGASLEYISLATAEGRLANFGRLLDGGASLHLTTIRPTQPAPVWTAVVTGKLPQSNGVRSAADYLFGAGEQPIELLPDLVFAHALVHLGLLKERPHDSRAAKARSVWQILSSSGIDVGITGLPLTHPAYDVRGYLVSDRTHLAANTLLPVDDRGLVYPADLFTGGLPGPMDATVASSTALDPLDPATSAVPQLLSGALTARDSWYWRVSATLTERHGPRVSAVRLDGIDTAGHLFLRYALPSAFGDVTDQERLRYGQVLDRQYAAVDAQLGQLLGGLSRDDLVLVVSGFGMEPVSPAKRLLARVMREPALGGTHEGAPAGFLIAYGAGVAPGRRPVGSVVDVTPTLLYVLGLPVARDMSGSARADLFTREFTTLRPVTFIPSYDH